MKRRIWTCSRYCAGLSIENDHISEPWFSNADNEHEMCMNGQTNDDRTGLKPIARVGWYSEAEMAGFCDRVVERGG